jgi:hypothetical protein
MNKIDSGYDTLLEANYELHKSTLSDLKTLVKSWYPNTDFTKFDNRFIRDSYEPSFAEMKKAGLSSSYFYAYKEDDKYFLLDGFNRLLTEYGELDLDCTIYIKIITDKLEDHKLMGIMFRLNMWKLQGSGHWDLKPDQFFDRGFRLLLHKKFDIEIFHYDRDIEGWYENRLRDKEDMSILQYYTRKDLDFCDAFAFSLAEFKTLFSNPNIINDLKDLIKANDYRTAPFKNYEMFIQGFARFLAWKRVNGDDGEHKFEAYLTKLKENKSFFKKLGGMSGTDSTRINIYKFFRNKL